MTDIDYILLFAVLTALVVLVAVSKRTRIIVSQCVFHPTATGHLAIWDDDVAYNDNLPRGLTPKPPKSPTTRLEEPEAPVDAAKATRNAV